MKRSILGACMASALALSGCGGASEGAAAEATPSATEKLDGTQNYATVTELHQAVKDTGVSCGDLKEEKNPSLATAQGTCAVPNGDLVLQLWDDAKHRDDGTTDLIMLLSDASLGYCFVLGRGEGDEGAWSVNAGDRRSACHDLADELGGEVFEADAEPAPTTPPPPPVAAPAVFTGSGDSVVQIAKPSGATVVIATITGNSAGRYFGVKAIDGDRDTLVNTTDPYNGSTLMDANVGGTSSLQVTAVGPWSITLTDLRSAPTFSSGAYTGSGDAVAIYQGTGRIAAITGNAEGRYFGVKAYGSGGSGGGLVNTTDPYTGTVPWPTGPVIVVVTATGDWSITVT